MCLLLAMWAVVYFEFLCVCRCYQSMSGVSGLINDIIQVLHRELLHKQYIYLNQMHCVERIWSGCECDLIDAVKMAQGGPSPRHALSLTMTNVPWSVKYVTKGILYGFPCEMDISPLVSESYPHRKRLGWNSETRGEQNPCPSHMETTKMHIIPRHRWVLLINESSDSGI